MILLSLNNAEILYLISLSLVIILKIVCFILGYLTIKLGYNLISSGVKGEFKFSANFLGFKSDLASLSPGLLFVLLGVMLIMVAIYVDKSVDLKEKAVSVPMTSTDSIRHYIPPNLFDSSNQKNKK